MNSSLLISLSLIAGGIQQTEVRPREADERIVFHTVAGDLVFALYPDVAPRHVEQLLRLVRLGVYDTTYFHRVEPGFVVQEAGANGRRLPMTRTQRDAIVPLKAEFSNLRHQRAMLSMAREDGKPDSADTSFSILLGNAPHLDGQYTIFGHVERGMFAVEKMLEVPRGANNAPLVRLEVTKAEVLTKEELANMAVQPAQTVPIPPEVTAAINRSMNSAAREEVVEGISFMVSGVLLMIVVAALTYMFSSAIPPRMLLSINLLSILIGGFILFVILTPVGQTNQWFAAVLFMAVCGLFRLMSQFESPA